MRFSRSIWIGSIAAAMLNLGICSTAAAGTIGRVVSQYEIDLEKISDPQMKVIADRYSIEGRRDQILTVYVPQKESSEFLRMAPTAKLIEADVDAWMRNLSREDRAGYLELDEYEALFKKYESENPETVKILDLDWMKTDGGKKVLILKVSSDVEKENPNKPNIVFTGSTHGDEWISTAVVMGVLDKLIAEKETDSRLAKIVDWTTTYWIPSASPDSYHRSRETQGVDPNRVYPYPGKNSDGQILIAKNFMKWYDELRPAGVIDFHAFQGSILWPWGYKKQVIDDQKEYDRFDEVAGKMADQSGYIHGPTATTIYVAKGVTLDAWYYLYDSLSMTIEIGSSSKKPPASQIQRHVDENTESTWTFIESLFPDSDPNDDDDDDDDESSDSEESTGSSESGEDSESSTSSTDGSETDEEDTSSEENTDEVSPSSDSDDDDDDDDDQSSSDVTESNPSSSSDSKDSNSVPSSPSTGIDESTDGGCACSQSQQSPKGALLGLFSMVVGLRIRRSRLGSKS